MEQQAVPQPLHLRGHRESPVVVAPDVLGPIQGQAVAPNAALGRQAALQIPPEALRAVDARARTGGVLPSSRDRRGGVCTPSRQPQCSSAKHPSPPWSPVSAVIAVPLSPRTNQPSRFPPSARINRKGSRRRSPVASAPSTPASVAGQHPVLPVTTMGALEAFRHATSLT